MSVYVVQNHSSYNSEAGIMEPRFDLSPAEKFGELVYLLPPIAVPNRPKEIIHKLQEKLSNFSDQDYLLLIGNPCFIGWVTAIAAKANRGKVKMLQWNGRRKQYYEISATGLI